MTVSEESPNNITHRDIKIRGGSAAIVPAWLRSTSLFEPRQLAAGDGGFSAGELGQVKRLPHAMRNVWQPGHSKPWRPRRSMKDRRSVRIA